MKLQKLMLKGVAASVLLAFSGAVLASGFALTEQNASGLGNAYAGGAAIADDASTVFFNPAGMARLNGKQMAVAVNLIKPSAKFSGTGLNANGGGDAGSTATVPNAYFVAEINPRLKAGVGLNAPFGLQTEYPANWAGAHQAIKSKLDTVNLNPSLSYQVNDALSIGAGLDYQHINGELTNYGGAVLGMVSVKGSDTAWGYNLGLLYNTSADTRIGASYRSSISYHLSGSLASSLPMANGPVTLDIKLPESFSISVFHRLSEQTDLMADISRTNWSSFKQVRVVNATGSAISNTIENWKDTTRISIGATRHYTANWSARVGLAYDQAPVADAFRTARIPDNDRTWLAVGGQYKIGSSSAIDFGYAHLFVSNASINSTNPAPALVGTYQNAVDILSAQYTQGF